MTTAAVSAAQAPLLDAARHDDRDRVAALLKARPGITAVNVRAADGATALHWAAYHDDLLLARMLL
ncbi:MAG TPA: hypothetical protein VKB36_23840, partial [Vicinamibacterales bacterium]|nr:hypothetical protein [Vicinamibacterales bacterium]